MDRNTMIALLLVKEEAVEGTDAVPVIASNAVQIVEPFNAQPDFQSKPTRPRVVRGAFINPWRPLTPSGAIDTWPIRVHGRGSKNTTAYSASNLPDFHPLMLAAGLAATVTTTLGSEKVEYALAATALKSATVYGYADGKLRKLLGAKSDLTLKFVAGGPVELEFPTTGLYQVPADAATPSGATIFGTAEPPLALGAALTIDGFAAGVIREFTLSLGNGIQQRPSVNAPGGLAPPKVRTHAPAWSCVLEDPLIGTKDLEALHRGSGGGGGGGFFALSWTIGSIQYNRMKLLGVQRARIETYTTDDDNGTQVARIGGGLYDSDTLASDALTLTVD